MTFEEFEDKLKDANPRVFAATEIKINVASFRKQLRRAYDAGAAEARSGQLFDELFPPLRKRGI